MIDGTRASYDRVAEHYRDAIAAELQHKPLDRHLLAAFAELAGDGPVADLGAGPGHVANALCALGRQVTAIDLSPAMTRLAAPLVDGRAAVGDLAALPLRDGCLAGAVCFYAVIHLGDDQRAVAYRELARVLRPGGTAMISFHTSDADHPQGTVAEFDSWWDEPVELTFHFLDPELESKALTAAGLEVVARLDRAPHPGVEHASRRSYVIVRRPDRPPAGEGG